MMKGEARHKQDQLKSGKPRCTENVATRKSTATDTVPKQKAKDSVQDSSELKSSTR